ncbi:MAG: lipopolysaccharide biosynthesis protein [Sarcina sp.]
MNKYKNLIMGNKFLKNFIVLFTGEGLSSLLGMLSVIIIVKAIGLEGNGKILSIQTYCLLLTNILGFKSFQALIKYLSKSLADNDYVAMKKYIQQSYILDIIAAIVTMVVSFIFVQPYSMFMGWDNELVKYSYIFIIAIIFQVQGTPIGILRMFNKFNYITYNNIGVGILRFIFYVIGIIYNVDLTFYMYVEIFLYIFPNIILNYLAYKTLKANNLHDFYNYKFAVDKEFFKFNFYSNIASTIDIPVGTLTTIMINKYLGYSDISVYKIFEKIGSIIGKIGSPISQIIYPELTERIAQKKYKSAKKISDKLLIGIGGSGVVITILAYITHELWLGLFIENYNNYIGTLVVYLFFTVFINATVGIHSLFLALNYIKYTIPILLAVNSVYIVLLFILISNIGLLGVVIALFGQAIIVIVIKVKIMKKNNYTEMLGRN